MPVTPSDLTPAELLALQALLDRSTRTATPAVADSVAYHARQMSAAEFVEFWRSVRLVAMATVGPAGHPHIAPVHAELAGTMLRPRIYEDTVRRQDIATNPRVAFTTWRADGAVAILYGRAREVAGSLRPARPGQSGRPRRVVTIEFSSRASTRCARRSASRACPPRPGSDSATRPSPPTSATSSELGVALAPRPVATRYRCSSLALPPSRRPSSRFEPASVPGWRRIQVSRPRSSPDPRPRKVPNREPRPHGARGPSHASSARRSGVAAQLADIEGWRDDHFRHRLPIIRSGEVGRRSPRLVMAFCSPRPNA